MGSGDNDRGDHLCNARMSYSKADKSNLVGSKRQ
jgi:hypothetical protein